MSYKDEIPKADDFPWLAALIIIISFTTIFLVGMTFAFYLLVTVF